MVESGTTHRYDGPHELDVIRIASVVLQAPFHHPAVSGGVDILGGPADGREAKADEGAFDGIGEEG